MDMRDSIENEWLCLRIFHAFGIAAANAEILTFGKRKVLAVERFDRSWQSSGWIARLPQEDFCQAFGLPYTKKYEEDGGPGMREILRTLDSSSRAASDKRTFVKTQLIFWMLGAIDGHAKNFSIFHERGNTYRLTPIYDVLSAWPIIGKAAKQLQWQKIQLAMSIKSKNVHWKMSEIKPRHWDAVTRLAGIGDAKPLLEEVLIETPRVIEKVNAQIPSGFPSVISDRIFDGLKRTAKILEEKS